MECDDSRRNEELSLDFLRHGVVVVRPSAQAHRPHVHNILIFYPRLIDSSIMLLKYYYL